MCIVFRGSEGLKDKRPVDWMDGTAAVKEPRLGDQQQSIFNLFMGEDKESSEPRFRPGRETDWSGLGGALGVPARPDRDLCGSPALRGELLQGRQLALFRPDDGRGFGSAREELYDKPEEDFCEAFG